MFVNSTETRGHEERCWSFHSMPCVYNWEMITLIVALYSIRPPSPSSSPVLSWAIASRVLRPQAIASRGPEAIASRVDAPSPWTRKTRLKEGNRDVAKSHRCPAPTPQPAWRRPGSRTGSWSCSFMAGWKRLRWSKKTWTMQGTVLSGADRALGEGLANSETNSQQRWGMAEKYVGVVLLNLKDLCSGVPQNSLTSDSLCNGWGSPH